jgi:sugar transferase EpsL
MTLPRRIFDLAAASCALLLATPLLALIAAALRSEPLFKQRRIGLDGREFTLYKFRTMTNSRNTAGELLPDELRLTAFGRFLRQTSLDELPQLWNVLKGDMSLVGPRPLLPEYLPLYTSEQRRRHEVKPGVTGWAQIHGRNTIDWEEKFNLDLWYVDHQSFMLDCKILCLTVLKVLSAAGVSQGGHATMPRFTGSSRSEAAQ